MLFGSACGDGLRRSLRSASLCACAWRRWLLRRA